MLKNKLATGLLAIAVIGAEPSLAQSQEELNQLESLQAEIERAELQSLEQQSAAARQVEMSDAEMQRARAEMEQARLRLEESARVLATRSQSLPQLQNLNYVLANGSWIGNRAQIGVSIIDSEDGALVTSVSSGSDAEKVGVKVGDVIQSIDGIDLVDGEEAPNAQLIARLRDVKPGDSVSIVVERAGEALDFEVATADGPAWVTAASGVNQNYARVLRDFGQQGAGNFAINSVPANDPLNVNVFRPLQFAYSPWGDMELVTLTEELGRYFDADEGLLVVSSPEDDAIGIQDGDVILAISGRIPNSPEHAIRILSSFEAGETIEFSLMRDGRRESIEYGIPESDPDIFPSQQVFPVLPE